LLFSESVHIQKWMYTVLWNRPISQTVQKRICTFIVIN
jgi:hypothetical protein